MQGLHPFLVFLHLITVVFMAAPLYSLVIVNERALFSPQMIYAVDRYMETMIAKNAGRCYVFQATVLLTGVVLVWQGGTGWNWILLAKTALLFLLMGLLTVVHLGIQPRIEKLLGQFTSDPISPEAALAIKPLRMLRKRLAAICLFLVIVAILLGAQVYQPFPLAVNLTLSALAGLFAFRAFKHPVRLGWW